MTTATESRPLGKMKRFLGEGTYGIIIGCPRLPSEGETRAELLDSLIAINQVSKVIKDRDDIDKLNAILGLINQRFNPTNLAHLQTQIVIPSQPQVINWRDLANSPEEIAFLRCHKITKRRTKWQYLMERGTADLDIELRGVQSINQFKHFLKGFANIIDGVAALHKFGLVHTDIKLTNMIASWDGRYKLIDLDELADATILPSKQSYFEKIYHNVYYPYYTPAGVFLWVFGCRTKYWDNERINMVIRDLIKKNYDKEYFEYFTEISQQTLKIAADTELTKIIQSPYENDTNMREYLVDFRDRICAQSNQTMAHRELLLFNDRYSLGINLLILLTRYYKLTGQISGSKIACDITMAKCEFIPQSLISIIKLCCSPTNYGIITTDQVSAEYRVFITQLFRRFPFKFIIKLLSGLAIRRRSVISIS
jgi:serine/threonine protein kinase